MVLYATRDDTYHKLRDMIQNKDIFVKGDKDSSVVIMKKSDCVTKLDSMISGSIMNDIFVETTDNTSKNYRDFRTFYLQTFITMNTIKICNLIAIDQHLFIFIGTAKNHKFETLEDITVPNLKF